MNRLHRKSGWYLMVVLLIGLLALWGCPKKAGMTAEPEAPAAEQVPTAQETTSGDEEARERAAAEATGLQPVYFDFDRSFLRDGAREIMKANAQWLKAHPQARIRIEGNGDERGTREYNQALGQQRAASARKYLTDMGIAGDRITLISYGKEKPGCTESTENCWQQNRRDDFVVVSD